MKKLGEKCEELEKQTDAEFREKLKLTEELKASEETRERALSDMTRLKDQVKEYRVLYEANVKDSVVRKDSLEKKSLQNQELHKKFSKQAMILSEVGMLYVWNWCVGKPFFFSTYHERMSYFQP